MGGRSRVYCISPLPRRRRRTLALIGVVVRRYTHVGHASSASLSSDSLRDSFWRLTIDGATIDTTVQEQSFLHYCGEEGLVVAERYAICLRDKLDAHEARTRTGSGVSCLLLVERGALALDVFLVPPARSHFSVTTKKNARCFAVPKQ